MQSQESRKEQLSKITITPEKEPFDRNAAKFRLGVGIMSGVIVRSARGKRTIRSCLDIYERFSGKAESSMAAVMNLKSRKAMGLSLSDNLS